MMGGYPDRPVKVGGPDKNWVKPFWCCMIRFRYIIAALTALAPLALTPVANAQPKLEGIYTDWKVYSRGQGQSKICYALAEPETKSPRSVNHGDVYFLVSNWRSGAAKEQPSFLAGYSLKNTRAPEARIGSHYDC